jgi:hypothetical protein
MPGSTGWRRRGAEEVQAIRIVDDKGYTSKRWGDAGEMLIAAELTLGGVPVLQVPEIWPGYDVIASRLNPAYLSAAAATAAITWNSSNRIGQAAAASRTRRYFLRSNFGFIGDTARSRSMASISGNIEGPCEPSRSYTGPNACP